MRVVDGILGVKLAEDVIEVHVRIEDYGHGEGSIVLNDLSNDLIEILSIGIMTVGCEQVHQVCFRGVSLQDR